MIQCATEVKQNYPSKRSAAISINQQLKQQQHFAFSKSKQMGLDTVAISIATEEESTPVGFVIAAKDGAGSDQVCLDTVTTSSIAAVENRQVGLTTTVKAAVETGTEGGVDTVGTVHAAGETSTPICPDTTQSSTAAGEEDTRVYAQSVGISAEGADCKRGIKFPSPASATPTEKTDAGTLAERRCSVESGTSYAGEQDEGGRVHGCPTELVHDKRVKSMKRNLTRETRRADDSLTTLHHLKEEMESKQGEILVIQNESQCSNALKGRWRVSTERFLL
jgi:hypothetical protein